MLNSLCGRVGAAFRWALIGAFAMVAVGCATSNPPAPAAAASPEEEPPAHPAASASAATAGPSRPHR